MAGNNRDGDTSRDQSLKACEVFEKSPLRKGGATRVHYGTMNDVENVSTAAKEMVGPP